LFRFGFSTGLLSDFNKNDAKAAVKAWAQAIVLQGTVQGDPNVCFFDDTPSIENALLNRKVDGISMSTPEYLELRDRVKFDRFMIAQSGGTIYEEYLLLVPADSDITNLARLQGRSLVMLQQAQMCLATLWLDTLLLGQKLDSSHKLFSQVSFEPKLTKVVLPVFFRKADACLVTRKGFKTMCELNPQLGQQLRQLAISPGFVTGGFFFRAGYPSKEQDKFIAGMRGVRNTPAGNEVLTVFQTENLDEYHVSVFDSAIDLMNQHRQLLGRNDGARNTAVESSRPAALDKNGKLN
jgi:phosphonate transport system substrate-binding protein